MANTSGHSKKVTRNSIMFLSYCVGNIAAPQFFITSEASVGYPTGYRAILGSMSISIICCAIYGTGVYFENRQKMKNGKSDKLGPGNFEDESLLDLTDREKKGFL